MLKGVNTELFGDAVPFGDPAWYQSYNSLYYNDTHRALRKQFREFTEEYLMGNIHEWDEAGQIPQEITIKQAIWVFWRFALVGHGLLHTLENVPGDLSLTTFMNLFCMTSFAESPQPVLFGALPVEQRSDYRLSTTVPTRKSDRRSSLTFSKGGKSFVWQSQSLLP